MHTLTPTFTKVHMIGNDRRTSKTHQFTENYKPVRQSVIYTWQMKRKRETKMDDKQRYETVTYASFWSVVVCGRKRRSAVETHNIWTEIFITPPCWSVAMVTIVCHYCPGTPPNFRKERTGGGNNTDRKQCVRN